MFSITMWEMLERDMPYRGTNRFQVPALVEKVTCVRILGSTHDFSVFRICCFVLNFCSFVTYQGERPDGTNVTADQATTDAPDTTTNGLACTPSHHHNLEQNVNARARLIVMLFVTVYAMTSTPLCVAAGCPNLNGDMVGDGRGLSSRIDHVQTWGCVGMKTLA